MRACIGMVRSPKANFPRIVSGYAIRKFGLRRCTRPETASVRIGGSGQVGCTTPIAGVAELVRRTTAHLGARLVRGGGCQAFVTRQRWRQRRHPGTSPPATGLLPLPSCPSCRFVAPGSPKVAETTSMHSRRPRANPEGSGRSFCSYGSIAAMVAVAAAIGLVRIESHARPRESPSLQCAWRCTTAELRAARPPAYGCAETPVRPGCCCQVPRQPAAV